MLWNLSFICFYEIMNEAMYNQGMNSYLIVCPGFGWG